jgi:hypothetical protein
MNSNLLRGSFSAKIFAPCSGLFCDLNISLSGSKMNAVHMQLPEKREPPSSHFFFALESKSLFIVLRCDYKWVLTESNTGWKNGACVLIDRKQKTLIIRSLP